MFTNYTKIALRNLLKYKAYSLINILGLTIGLACCIGIFIFVYYELSYDRFHEKGSRICRANLQYHMGANQFDTPFCPVPLGPTLREEYPEVEKAARLYTLNLRNKDVYVKYQDRQFKEKGFYWADPAILDIFTIQFTKGNPQTALLNPNSVVMVQEMAVKYFGNTDPLGEMILLDNGSLYTVTGVMEKMPSNTHISFDFLASFSSLNKSKDPDWYDTAVLTYLLLNQEGDWQNFNAKMPAFSKKHVAPVIETAMGIGYDEFIESGNYFGFFVEPLYDLHLYSKAGEGTDPPGNIQTVVIFSGIAWILLLIASINFINLSTARSSLRANEVGVRKVAGSTRGQLIWQFLTETIILCLISLALAIITLEAGLPFINNQLGLHLSSKVLFTNFIPLFLLMMVILIGLLAGIYPAFILSGFKPVEVLKGKSQSGLKGKQFRNGLTLFQFSTSIVLIIGTLVIYRQLQFVRQKDLGFNKDQVVVIPNTAKLGVQQQTFKERLKQFEHIQNATYSDCLPQMMLEVKPFQKVGAESNENHMLITISTDHDFMDTYQFQISTGRFFERSYSTDTSAVLLNEIAVKALNLETPLNKNLILLGREPIKMDIIGVMKDFHIEPMQLQIRPAAVILAGSQPGEFLSLRIRPGRVKETLEFLKKEWQIFVPQQPLEYVFFDDHFGQVYQKEIQSGKIFNAFAVLSVFIACLGLYGLAAFTALKRTKEIGIRKVVGASTAGIFVLLSREFSLLVIIANIIAWPVAWYAMNQWLEGFAYRIQLEWWIFLLAGIVALLISLLTITYQALKSACANPVEALRYE